MNNLKEFKKIIKEVIANDGAKVVDINVKLDIVSGTYTANIIAIRNHVAYRYIAQNNEDGEVTVDYSGRLD